jgi:hypothetical protein
MYLFFFFFFCRTDMLCLLACVFALLLACTWHFVCFSETCDCWDVLNILEQSVQVVKKPKIRVISNFQRKLVLLLLYWLFCFTYQKIKHMSSSVFDFDPKSLFTVALVAMNLMCYEMFDYSVSVCLLDTDSLPQEMSFLHTMLELARVCLAVFGMSLCRTK